MTNKILHHRLISGDDLERTMKELAIMYGSNTKLKEIIYLSKELPVLVTDDKVK